MQSNVVGDAEVPFTFRALWQALWGAWAALLIPVVIIGGIVFGIFTATEAGAIAVLCFVTGAFFYRTLKPARPGRRCSDQSRSRPQFSSSLPQAAHLAGC